MNSKLQEKKSRGQTKKILLIAFLIIAIFGIVNNLNKTLFAIKKFINIIKPFLYGLVMGYLFLFPVKKLEKLITRNKKTKYNKIVKIFSLILVYFTFFGLLYFFLSKLLPFLYNAAIDILENTPKYLDSLEEFLINKSHDNQLLSSFKIENIFKNIRSLDVPKILIKYLKDFNIQNGVNAIFNAAGVIIKIFIAIVVSFNIILYNENLSKEMKFMARGILGNEKANRIKKIIKTINEVFINFIYGQFIDSVIVGIIFSIVFLILKIQYAVALGILIGIGNLIPYVGAFLSILITVIVTCFTGGIGKGALILAVSVGIQQIDAQIINPAIIGEKLDLDPPIIILTILIGGAYFGSIVVFLAAPILAVIKSILIEYIENKKIKNKVDKIKKMRKTLKLNKNPKYKKSYKLDYILNYSEQKSRKKKIRKPKIKKEKHESRI